VIGPTRGLQKIGMATDPQARLASLQTASPIDLLIHAAIAVPFGAAPDVEHQAHCLLGRMCVRNEWFEGEAGGGALCRLHGSIALDTETDEPHAFGAAGKPSAGLKPFAVDRVVEDDYRSSHEVAAPGNSAAELLPLFQPRTTSAVEERKIGLLEPGT
jgi:hypothetical protein